MQKYSNSFFLVIAAVLSLAACQKGQPTEVPVADDNSISFGAYTATSSQTKGSVVKPSAITDASTGSGIGVFAFYEPSATGDFNTYKYATPDFMYNQQVKYDGTKWTYNPVKFWPNNEGDKLSFFAYAPYVESTTWEDLGIKTDINASKLTVTFPIADNANDQQDQLWAAPQLNQTKPNTTEKVNFAFTHITSQVNLYAGVETDVASHTPGAWIDKNTEIEIKSIEFKNLSSSMTYSYALPIAADPSVTASSEKQSVILTSSDFIEAARKINKAYYGSKTSGEWTKLNAATSTMFLVPETMGNAIVTYTVTTTDPNLTDGKSVITNTVTCDLSGITMEAQKVYNLQFLIGMTSVKVSATVDEWDSPAVDEQINAPVVNKDVVFSVSSTKKVHFTKGNLYWDGSEGKYHLESSQTAYPTSWDANHVGHFYWSKTASVAYAENYSDDSAATGDKFFCGSANPMTIDGQSDLYALSSAEWAYLIQSRTNASTLYKNGVTVTNGGTSYTDCLIIAPDSYSGTALSAITDWSLSNINSLGLVCLPAAGYRDGSSFYTGGSSGSYWSSTPSEHLESHAYRLGFLSGGVDPSSGYYRNFGRSVRLVWSAN